MRNSSGFTLIEILVAVAIVGILAAIAIPAYSKYVQRGDLVEATQALSSFRVQMEQYYQDNASYGAAGACGNAGPPQNPPIPTLQNFTLTCASQNNGQTYTATATAKATSPVNGFIYTIDQSNNQSTLGIASNWGTLASPPPATWITK